eukprot:9328102-Prorocentrum_lima.AAC.1
MDMSTNNLRFYNVFRAKTGQTTTGHCNCGFAFPAKMWNITTVWKIYCSVDWTVLEREGPKDPDAKNP